MKILINFCFFVVLCPGFFTPVAYAGAKESKAAYAGRKESKDLMDLDKPDGSFTTPVVGNYSPLHLDNRQVRALIKVFDLLTSSECPDALKNERARLQSATEVNIVFSLWAVDEASAGRLKRELEALASVLTSLSRDASKIFHITLIFGEVDCDQTAGIDAVAEALKLFPPARSLAFKLTNSGINDNGVLLLTESIKCIYRDSISSDQNSLRVLSFQLGESMIGSTTSLFPLDRSMIGTKSLLVLSEMLKTFPYLEFLSLNIGDSPLSSEGVKELANGLGELQKLIRLDLSIKFNDIESNTAFALAEEVFSRLPNLYVFIFNVSGCGYVSSTATANTTARIALFKLKKRVKNRFAQLQFNVDI